MRVIARRLVDGGRLYLKSDVFDYLYRVRAFAEVSGAFRPLPAHAIPYGRMYLQKHPSFDPTLPMVPERADQFYVDEEVNPLSLIRGAPLIDRQQRSTHGRRRK